MRPIVPRYPLGRHGIVQASPIARLYAHAQVDDRPTGSAYCPTCGAVRRTYALDGHNHCGGCHSNLGPIR